MSALDVAQPSCSGSTVQRQHNAILESENPLFPTALAV